MIVNKPAVQALIVSLSGLTTYGVSWANDPQSAVNNRDNAQIKMRLRSYAGRGVDETRFNYDPIEETLETIQVGNRDVVLSLVCEAWQKSAEACEILDRVRTRLRRRSSMQALLAVNLALQTMEVTIDLPTSYDNRALSVASLDIHLAGLAVDDLGSQPDGPSDAETWIDTVNTNNIVPLIIPAVFIGRSDGASTATLLY